MACHLALGGLLLEKEVLLSEIERYKCGFLGSEDRRVRDSIAIFCYVLIIRIVTTQANWRLKSLEDKARKNVNRDTIDHDSIKGRLLEFRMWKLGWNIIWTKLDSLIALFNHFREVKTSHLWELLTYKKYQIHIKCAWCMNWLTGLWNEMQRRVSCGGAGLGELFFLFSQHHGKAGSLTYIGRLWKTNSLQWKVLLEYFALFSQTLFLSIIPR